jgi:glucose-1-phosphatase
VPQLSFLFDLGNVLTICDIHKGAREIARHSRVSDVEVVEKIMQAEIIDDFDRGTISGEEFAEHVAEVTGWRGSHEDLVKIWQNMLRPDEEMFALLESLHERGQHTYILSNINPYHVEYVMTEFPALQRTMGRIFSCECQLIKPDDAIFQHTAETLGLKPEHTVFIDDRLVNIEAARRAGYIAVHHTSASETRAIIEDLLS